MQFFSPHPLLIKNKIQTFIILLLSLFLVACGGGGSSDTTTSVNSVTLKTITLTPVSSGTAAGLTQQLKVTGNYSNGTSKVISPSIWSSSDVSVASVSTSGVIKSLKPGIAIITVTVGSITASTTITVTTAILQSITVTPAYTSTAAGLTQQMTATGNYSDGTSQLISAPTWNSSNTSVATVNSSGLMHTLLTGTSTITATLDGVSGSTNVAVTAATLQSISVDPAFAVSYSTSAPSSMGIGLTQQFIATGHYSNGTSQIITTPTWQSSNTGIATVSSTGVVHTISAGTTTITASLGTVSSSSTLTVTTTTLQSITFSNSGVQLLPPFGTNTPLSNLNLTVGFTNAIYAIGHFSDGSTQPLFEATWTSSNIAIATVIGFTPNSLSGFLNGEATGIAAGNVTITASFEGISASIPAMVSTATLTSITAISVLGNGPFTVGAKTNLTVNGNYSNGNFYTLNNIKWSSSDPTIATVDTTGNVSFVGAGTVTITASSSGFTSTLSFTVTPPPIVTISCNPASPTVISAAAWNSAFTKDSSDATNWLTVDSASCANDMAIGIALTNASDTDTIFYYGPLALAFTLPSGLIGGTMSDGRNLTVGESLGVYVNHSFLYNIIVQP